MRARGGFLAALVRRHPRRWGLLFAALLLGGYGGVLRPARVWVAAHVVTPLAAAVEGPAARPHDVVPGAMPTGVLAVPVVGEGAGRGGAGGAVAAWNAPAGLFFLLPGLFLAALFPARPLWLYLLGAHAALGLATLATFVLGQGLGWTPFAAAAHAFVETYAAAIVNLAVPALLFLACWRGAAPSHEPPPCSPRPASGEVDVARAGRSPRVAARRCGDRTPMVRRGAD